VKNEEYACHESGQLAAPHTNMVISVDPAGYSEGDSDTSAEERGEGRDNSTTNNNGPAQQAPHTSTSRRCRP
jgi:hypothetical protein